MNKQIRVIAEQAGDHYRTTKPGASTWPHPCVGAAVPKEFLDKFSELIIKECAKFVAFSMDSRLTPSEINQAIQQHFGIKE